MPEGFLVLTSIKDQGIALDEQCSGRVFNVEFWQFEKRAAGEMRPTATSFVEFLRWYKAKSEEN